MILLLMFRIESLLQYIVLYHKPVSDICKLGLRQYLGKEISSVEIGVNMHWCHNVLVSKSLDPLLS